MSILSGVGELLSGDFGGYVEERWGPGAEPIETSGLFEGAEIAEALKARILDLMKDPSESEYAKRNIAMMRDALGDQMRTERGRLSDRAKAGGYSDGGGAFSGAMLDITRGGQEATARGSAGIYNELFDKGFNAAFPYIQAAVAEDLGVKQFNADLFNQTRQSNMNKGSQIFSGISSLFS